MVSRTAKLKALTAALGLRIIELGHIKTTHGTLRIIVETQNGNRSMPS